MMDETKAIFGLTPAEIEKMSFATITEELGGRTFPPEIEPIVKRTIHTTADFDFADNLVFSDGAVAAAKAAIEAGCAIVTDTQMARSGISKKSLAAFGCAVECFIADTDVAERASRDGTTRAHAAVDKAIELHGGEMIFVCGNAPTALMRLREIIDAGGPSPRCIVGTPVGFVNVVAAKELIINCAVPSIVARGRKGGSAVAASIVNAILYQMKPREDMNR